MMHRCVVELYVIDHGVNRNLFWFDAVCVGKSGVYL